MWNRLWQMVIKEFLQIVRDPRTRFWITLAPIAQILIYGYAATFEVHHARMAVLDGDRTFDSRTLIARMSASGYLPLTVVDNPRQFADAIDRGDVALAIQILPGFSRSLHQGRTAHLEVITDGSDSNTALIALGYVSQIATQYAADYARSRLRQLAPALAARAPKIELAPRPWFNPSLKSRWFMVPGTIGAVLLTSVLMLAAFAIVREREIGTLEQLIVSPIRPVEFVLGKAIPAFVVSMIQLAAMIVIGVWWFRVPIHGSCLLLTAGTAIYVLSVLGIAFLLSSAASTQQQALVAAFFVMLPAILLSGFGWPISNMPAAMQWVTYLDPLRYYLVIIRACFIEGSGWTSLWPQFAALAALAAALLSVSVVRFEKSLE